MVLGEVCICGINGRLGLMDVGTLGCNEYFSGFDNIGHNDFLSLLFLWIIPK